jgi:hypothetical protein
MRVSLKSVAVFAIMILTATGLSACQQELVLPSSDVDYCTILADPPTKDGKQIAAHGRFRCDGNGADTITIKVSLQKQASNGSWKTLTSGTFVAHGTATSRSKSESQRTRTVLGACSKGHFRSVIHAVEKSKKHTQVYNNTSVFVPSPCNNEF